MNLLQTGMMFFLFHRLFWCKYVFGKLRYFIHNMEGSAVSQNFHGGVTNDYISVKQATDFEDGNFWSGLTKDLNIFSCQKLDDHHWQNGLKSYYHRMNSVITVLGQAHELLSRMNDLRHMRRVLKINGSRSRLKIEDILSPSELRVAMSLRGYVSDAVKTVENELHNLHILIEIRTHSCKDLHSTSFGKTRRLSAAYQALKTALETIFATRASQEMYSGDIVPGGESEENEEDKKDEKYVRFSGLPPPPPSLSSPVASSIPPLTSPQKLVSGCPSPAPSASHSISVNSAPLVINTR